MSQAKKVSQTKSQPVSSSEIQDLMWGYLAVHKDVSQRALAIQIANDATKKGESISIETIQRAFGQSAKVVQPVIKDLILQYLKEDGYKTPKQIKTLVKKEKKQVQDALTLIDSEKVNDLARLWIVNHGSQSKRTLAKQIHTRLSEQGYNYNLGSLQNILCGKIKETKKIIYDTLKQILIDETYGDEVALKRAFKELSEEKRELFETVPAKGLAKKCQEFLIRFPEWTKRKLAIQLAHDLKKQGFDVSYNSLQYALGGKRDSIKKIIETTFMGYFDNPPNPNQVFLGSTKITSKKRRQNLNQLHKLVEQADGNEKDQMNELYLKARQEELKRIWKDRLKKRKWA